MPRGIVNSEKPSVVNARRKDTSLEYVAPRQKESQLEALIESVRNKVSQKRLKMIFYYSTVQEQMRSQLL